MQAKIDAAVREAAELREKGPLFEDVADAFWAEKEKKLKFESLMAHHTKAHGTAYKNRYVVGFLLPIL